MLEIMILYLIWEYELTMYYIRKKIHDVFGDFSKPSFGALRPALMKLERLGYIKTRKSISDGGRVTCHYSLTPNGKKAFKQMLLEDLSANPINLLQSCAVRIIASEYLSKNEQAELINNLLRQVEYHKIEAENRMENNKNMRTYQRIMIDNLSAQYGNFMKLLERLAK